MSDLSAMRVLASQRRLAGKCVVFNVGGNKYRLIAAVHYQKQDRDRNDVEGRVYVRNVLTHQEYDKGAWKYGCDC
jgi:mRNA interferase HigB